MRTLVRLAAALAVVLLGLAPAAAYAAWGTGGAGTGSATATSVNRASAPTATRGTARVTLGWGAVTLANGTPATSYDVLRHAGTTTTTVCSAVTTRTCDDLSPLPGAVQYGVVARIGTAWRGAESPLTSFTYDQTAPVTTLATTPASPNAAGWFNGDVTVTLTATDPGGALASGVKEIRYAVNGGATVAASGSTTSFLVSQEQLNTVTYWSVDNLGNTEAPVNQAQVKLDKTAPVSTITPASSTAWTRTQTVTLTAADATSGVASIVYQLDGGAVTTYTGPFTLADGAHTVTYHAVDAAGNAETDRSATLKVDTGKPTASVNPASGASTTSVTITGADALSGVNHVEYSLDGAGYVTGSTVTWAVGSGTHTLAYRAVDNAGNVGDPLTATYASASPVAPPTLTSCTTVNGSKPYVLSWTRAAGAPNGGYRFYYTDLSTPQANLVSTNLPGSTSSFTTPPINTINGTFNVVAIVNGVESAPATAVFNGSGSSKTCTIQ